MGDLDRQSFGMSCVNENPFESPQVVDKPRSVLSPWTVGVLVFVPVLLLGFAATHAYRERALANLPAGEVYEAWQRDTWAVELTLLGWFVTVLVAITLAGLAAAAASRRSRQPRTERE